MQSLVNYLSLEQMQVNINVMLSYFGKVEMQFNVLPQNNVCFLNITPLNSIIEGMKSSKVRFQIELFISQSRRILQNHYEIYPLSIHFYPLFHLVLV